MRFVILISLCLITLAGQAQAQSVTIRPDRLREGDGKTRNITVEVAATRLSVSVNYTADPGAVTVVFIPRFVVEDNSSDDRNPESGKIRVVLPKAFDRTGVYTIQIDDPGAVLRLVHEPNNSSYFRQFADWLVGGAGSGQRGSDSGSKYPTARERIEQANKTGSQEKLAIWTASLPPLGEQIDQESTKLTIKSAVMPAWSTKGNDITCSAWRDGRWVIATYTIDPSGNAVQRWQWLSRNNTGSDFSPVWSPDGDAIAFVRLNRDGQSDIWIVELDRNQRPKRELKITSLGNLQAVLGWDKDLGILFETKSEDTGRQVWASKPVMSGTAAGVHHLPLANAYSLLRGSAPIRGTLIYDQEKDGRPTSVIYEMNSAGKPAPLLVSDSCYHKWSTISHDEKWIAFEFACPR